MRKIRNDKLTISVRLDKLCLVKEIFIALPLLALGSQYCKNNVRISEILQILSVRIVDRYRCTLASGLSSRDGRYQMQTTVRLILQVF